MVRTKSEWIEYALQRETECEELREQVLALQEQIVALPPVERLRRECDALIEQRNDLWEEQAKLSGNIQALRSVIARNERAEDVPPWIEDVDYSVDNEAAYAAFLTLMKRCGMPQYRYEW